MCWLALALALGFAPSDCATRPAAQRAECERWHSQLQAPQLPGAEPTQLEAEPLLPDAGIVLAQPARSQRRWWLVALGGALIAGAGLSMWRARAAGPH